jgi:site-specific recombinase XerC
MSGELAMGSPCGRDRAIMETFYATGIRAGELSNLKLKGRGHRRPIGLSAPLLATDRQHPDAVS